MALFLGGDSAALPIARHIQLIATWGFILFGMTMVFFGVVRANGAVLGPLAILFIAMFPLRLGFAVVMRPLLGVDALWWSFPVGSISTVALAGLFYRYGPWRKARLTVPMAHETDAHAHIAVEPGGSLKPAG